MNPTHADRSFLAVNMHATSMISFFKAQDISDKTVSNRIGEVSNSLFMAGIGTRDSVAPHSFKATCITRLLDILQCGETTA